MNTEINSPEHQAQVREAERQLSKEVPHLEKHLQNILSLQEQAMEKTKQLLEVTDGELEPTYDSTLEKMKALESELRYHMEGHKGKLPKVLSYILRSITEMESHIVDTNCEH